MARADALSLMYAKNKSPLDFQWDSLCGPGVNYFLSPTDVGDLHSIATSIKMNGDPVKKEKMIIEIMKRRDFMRFHAGTNRIVFTHYDFPHIVAKTAIDRVGLNDNPREFRNQFELKPFVTKCFDHSPCGTVATFERVEGIDSIEEFAYVYEDVYELITKCLVGKYVLEDIGSKFFNNYGIRKGFGVCLLDYPYMYRLDGRKLFCNRPVFPNSTEPVCGGEIDYDDGFNYLVCRHCGKVYSAKDLEDKEKQGLIKIKGGSDMNLDMYVIENGVKIKVGQQTDVIKKPTPKAMPRTTKVPTVYVIENGVKIEVGSKKEPKEEAKKPVEKKVAAPKTTSAQDPIRKTAPSTKKRDENTAKIMDEAVTKAMEKALAKEEPKGFKTKEEATEAAKEEIKAAKKAKAAAEEADKYDKLYEEAVKQKKTKRPSKKTNFDADAY